MKRIDTLKFAASRRRARRTCAAGVIVLASWSALAQPLNFYPRGAGGGGAMYSASINPSNGDEYYIACDMSGIYHTTDFGLSYSLANFQTIQGGPCSKVQFTADPNILYSISYTNDAQLPVKSTDGGQSWQVLSGNPDATEATYSIWTDFTSSNRVIISYYGSVYASSDGGSSFHNVHNAASSGAGVNVGGAFFDGSSIYLGTNDGLLVSTDGGSTFSVANVGGLSTGEQIFSFAAAKMGSTVRFYCLTADASNIYVGITGGDYWGFMKGVYSLDYGAPQWTQRMSGITSGTDYPMFIAASPADTSTVYVGGGSSAGAPDIMKSTSAGRSWTHVFLSSNNANIATGWSGDGGDRGWGYGECAYSLEVAPGDAQRVLFTDEGFVHATSDGGSSWHQAYLASPDQNPPGAKTPQGKNYHSIGLEVTSCWQVFWADANNMFACFTDIRGLRSADAGLTWSFKYTGHTANTMYRIAQSPTGVLYAATSNVHDMYESTHLQDNPLDAPDTEGKIIFSTDMGATWNDLHVFGHPVFWVAIDPTSAGTMYASVIHSTLGGVYRTTDLQDGASSVWSKLPGPPRTQGHPASIVVLKDGSVLCTYSGRRDSSGAFTASSGLFQYTPSSGTWADLSDPAMRYWAMDVVVDPSDSTQKKWYVGVFSGWGGPPNGLGGLYQSTNRGVSWKQISNLDRVTSCTINPSSSSEMYLTTETNGLWRTNTLTSPAPVFSLVTSYPFRQPQRVFYNPYDLSQIWVSSFGAGMMLGTGVAVSVQNTRSTLPGAFRLEQNYPNPFNPSTTIRYTLSRSTLVTLKVYNLLGEEVRVLVHGYQGAGEHSVRFDGTGLSSGVYFYRIWAGDDVKSRKLVLLR